MLKARARLDVDLGANRPAVHTPVRALESAKAEFTGVGDIEELDHEELRRLNDALDEAEAEYQRGEYVTADVVLRELRGTSSA